MKKLAALVLVMVMVSASQGTQYLTVNGQPLNSITLGLDEICTIEVVSDDGTPYMDLLELKGIDKDDLTLLETKPEAGEDATVTIESRTSYALLAEGPGLAAGVHFIFQFVALEPGVVEIELWESGGVFPLDSIEITVAEPESAGTVFTYQGRLIEGSNPVHGEYDMEFKIYRSLDADIPFGVVTKDNVNVDTGIFTVELDFGSGIFDGDARWLEIGTRPGELTDPNAYTFLSPWQKINPAPYAVHALHAADADTLDGMDAGDFRPAGDIKHLLQEFVVAAGQSVSAGDVVSFLGGYVQTGFAPGDSIAYGSEQVFNAGATEFSISVAALSENKFVIAYVDADNSDFGTAIVGEISGNTISYGSESVFNAAETYNISVAALSSGKFVVAFMDSGNSDYGTAIIGNVSGATITWGSEYVFNTFVTWDISVAALSSSKFVAAYLSGGAFGVGAAIIGDISGTTITYGPSNVYNSDVSRCNAVSALSSSKFVVAYRDQGNSNYGTSVIGDISVNVISFGSEFVFNPASTNSISAAALSSGKFVAAYEDESNSESGTAVIGDVSGTTIAYGLEYVFNTNTELISVASLSSTKFTAAYRDLDNSGYGTAMIGNVSGNTITCGSEYIFNSDLTYYISVTTLSSSRFVVAYQDHGNSGYGTAVIGDIASDRVVGIAQKSKTAGSTVPVIIGGISDVHSGLTPGEVYFSEASGNLTTVGTDYRIGLAISASEILLDSNRSNVDQFFGDMIFANNFRITEGTTFEGLILKNQLNQEILSIDQVGNLNINGLSFTNPVTPTARWIMFEDKNGPCLQNLQNGEIYDFVIRKRHQAINTDRLINLEKTIQDLQVEVKSLKAQLQIKN